MTLRQYVGHAPLMCTGGGVIVENERGEILLQRRRDNGLWGVIGGAMEMGENILDTAMREAREEAGITPLEMSLFGIYTGKDRIITYPNGDICCVTSVIFRAKGFEGDIVSQESEVLEHRFFPRDALPEDIAPFDRAPIFDWRDGREGVIVR